MCFDTPASQRHPKALPFSFINSINFLNFPDYITFAR